MEKSHKKILIFRKLQNEEIAEIRKEKNATIYCLDTCSLDSEFDFELITKPKDLNLIWKNKILNFTEKTIKEENILSYFSSLNNEFNIWFYHKFKLYFQKNDAFFEILSVIKFTEKNDDLIIFSNTLQAKYFKEWTRLRIIKHQTQTKKTSKISFYINALTIFLVRIFKSRKIFKANTFLMHNFVKSYAKTEYKDNLILNNKVWANLHVENKEKFTIIEESEIFSNNGNNDFSKQNYKLLNSSVFTFEYLLFRLLFSPKLLFKIKNEFKNIASQIVFLEEQINDSVDIMILDFFKSSQKTSLFYMLKYYSYYNLFSKLKTTKSAINHSENTSSGKIFLDAARANQIITFGVQHGSINQQNIAYNFTQNEQNYGATPNYTFIWGQESEEVLLNKGKYTKKQLLTTGQLRSDAINFYKSKDKEFRNAICFFTQPQFDEKERKSAAECLIKAATNNKDISLFIKIHPSEKPNLYLDLIRKYKPKNVEIYENDKSLYSVLSEINYAVTCYSTVGIEALLFDLPLIIFDSQMTDKAEYIKNDVAYLVRNQKEVDQIFEDIINNKISIKPKSKKYIENNYFSIDGKVSERTINFLESIVA